MQSSMTITTAELEQAQQLLGDQNHLIANLEHEIGRLTVALKETTVMWSTRNEALVAEIEYLKAEIHRHIVAHDAVYHRLSDITAQRDMLQNTIRNGNQRDYDQETWTFYHNQIMHTALNEVHRIITPILRLHANDVTSIVRNEPEANGLRSHQNDRTPDYVDEIHFFQLTDQQLAELVNDAVQNGFLDVFDENPTGDVVEVPGPRGFPNPEAMDFISSTAAETHAD